MQNKSNPDNDNVVAIWEARLASEGLAPLDNGNSISPQIFNPYSKRYITQVNNVEDLKTSDRNKFILGLYNDGKSYRYISTELISKYPTETVTHMQVARIVNKWLKKQAQDVI